MLPASLFDGRKASQLGPSLACFTSSWAMNNPMLNDARVRSGTSKATNAPIVAQTKILARSQDPNSGNFGHNKHTINHRQPQPPDPTNPTRSTGHTKLTYVNAVKNCSTSITCLKRHGANLESRRDPLRFVSTRLKGPFGGSDKPWFCARCTLQGEITSILSTGLSRCTQLFVPPKD